MYEATVYSFSPFCFVESIPTFLLCPRYLGFASPTGCVSVGKWKGHRHPKQRTLRHAQCHEVSAGTLCRTLSEGALLVAARFAAGPARASAPGDLVAHAEDVRPGEVVLLRRTAEIIPAAER